jgi:hypothetical protein
MRRIAVVLLALPFLAFDCGGKDEPPNPFGTNCRLQIRGAVSEDEWCIVAAHDYAQDPVAPQNEWGFILSAYQANNLDVGGGVGVFIAGRPALGVPYGWSGASSNVTGGSATRYAGSMLTNPPTAVETHSAVELAGTGALTITFSQIPPPGAVGAQSIGVHGTLSATLPSDTGGAPVTFTATF